MSNIVEWNKKKKDQYCQYCDNPSHFGLKPSTPYGYPWGGYHQEEEKCRTSQGLKRIKCKNYETYQTETNP